MVEFRTQIVFKGYSGELFPRLFSVSVAAIHRAPSVLYRHLEISLCQQIANSYYFQAVVRFNQIIDSLKTSFRKADSCSGTLNIPTTCPSYRHQRQWCLLTSHLPASHHMADGPRYPAKRRAARFVYSRRRLPARRYGVARTSGSLISTSVF